MRISGTEPSSVILSQKSSFKSNDIVDNLVSVARLFADDTSMSAASSVKHEIENALNADLNTLQEWSHNWLVHHMINPWKFIG